jgi:Fur family ferric uptake transcriptional regulator
MSPHAAFTNRSEPSPWGAVRAIMSMAPTLTSSVLPFEARLKKMSDVRRASAVEMDKTTSRESRIERLCAERGMRMTGQRRVIAKVLSEADDHPDVEEVYRRASARDARISLSTVYRTVRLFEGAGILERHEFGAGRRARYEPAGHGHHDHLINVDTGEVIEFKNEQIERLQEIVARELGYSLIGHRLELFGTPLPSGPHKNRKS